MTRFGPGDPGFDAAIRAHEIALRRGEPGYLDPQSGAFVFTAAAHLARGRCCGSGCRHCPYEAGERVDCCETGCPGCPFTDADQRLPGTE
ncbi:DUF5522 domain-containing protein [Egicoccus sp. AB-alg6-2]|uniref:DUF5522 domain-containing protein n=1 Tax=Egicoccus sp. AB-alg6-2 TaxID=3242692 RepID=UPI00359DB1A6